MPCDVKLLSKRTDRSVRARSARRDQYTHTVTSGGNGFSIGTCCFDGAVDATEKIDLVSYLKHILVQPDGLGRASREFENLVCDRIAPAHGADRYIGRRIATGMHFGNGSTCCGEVRVSGGEVTVRLQRFLHQIVETRVVVQVPPSIRWWRGSLKCGIHAEQWCRRALGQCRCPIVWPNVTRHEKKDCRSCHDSGAHGAARQAHHCGFRPCARKSGIGDAGPSGAALR